MKWVCAEWEFTVQVMTVHKIKYMKVCVYAEWDITVEVMTVHEIKGMNGVCVCRMGVYSSSDDSA